MINGAHFLFYSKDAEADRAFLRDVLQLRFVDVGHGWMIFALPPAEVGVHPTEGDFVQDHGGEKLLGAVLYFMCDDLKATMADMQSRGVECTSVVEAPWGSKTTFKLPSGGEIGLYQPSHATAI
jgi:catechol 2,3-dioxygenase-like lactoylglutathione lyase family enzyme